MERESDTLFIALTRPAMMWGVPFEAFFVNAGLTAALVMWGGRGNVIYYAAAPVLHFILRLLASRDHNFFRIWTVWARTKGRAYANSAFGGSTLEPLPGRPSRPEELISGV